MPQPEFRSFCHISEYAAHGYSQLHKLIATSDPLILWSPSSVLLSSRLCRIEEREFLRYLEAGHVRIMGRHNWITSESFRNDHPWRDGASWVPSLDNVIRRLGEEDRDKDLLDRRVIIADDEQGLAKAPELLDQNRGLERAIRRAVAGETTPGYDIPIGVLQSASRGEATPRELALRILRDAYNHGDAYRQAQAEAPFLLSPVDSSFVQWLARFGASRADVDPMTDQPDAAREELARRNQSSLSNQLLALLGAMDDERGHLTSLDRFMRSDTHKQLARWYSTYCRLAASNTDARFVDQLLTDELSAGLARSDIKATLTDWRKDYFDAGGYAAGLGLGLAGLAFDGVGPISIAGVLVSLLPAGRGLLRRLGYVSATYTGESWPFVYTYGAGASGRRLGRMKALLAQLRQGEYGTA